MEMDFTSLCPVKLSAGPSGGPAAEGPAAEGPAGGPPDSGPAEGPAGDPDDGPSMMAPGVLMKSGAGFPSGQIVALTLAVWSICCHSSPERMGQIYPCCCFCSNKYLFVCLLTNNVSAIDGKLS